MCRIDNNDWNIAILVLPVFVTVFTYGRNRSGIADFCLQGGLGLLAE